MINVAPDKKISIKPRRLMPGDTIGVVAPSGAFKQDRFFQGVAFLESMGFRVSYDDGLFAKHEYLAGSDMHRAGQINRMFADDTIKAVICVRGGYGAMRILSLLDYDTIRNHPKLFVGFSDISALLSVFNTHCGLVVFHGPMVTSLADVVEETRTTLLAALTTEKKLELTPSQGLVIRAGQASGTVAGGNLTTLCHLLGTPYAPRFDKQILLLEDKDEAAYRIDRMLSQMKLAGCFDGLAGLILGSFESCGNVDQIYRIVQDIFNDSDIPILAGFDIGHGKPNLTLPLGLAAILDADHKRLKYNETATV